MAAKGVHAQTLTDRIKAVSGTAPPARPQIVVQRAPFKKQMRDKRSAERVDVFKEGVLVTERGERLRVVLKNISTGGARIDFARGGSAITGRLLLQEPTLKVSSWVSVVWKTTVSAGLRFEPA